MEAGTVSETLDYSSVFRYKIYNIKCDTWFHERKAYTIHLSVKINSLFASAHALFWNRVSYHIVVHFNW
jgi:hypothetical protein